MNEVGMSTACHMLDNIAEVDSFFAAEVARLTPPSFFFLEE